MWYVIQYKNFVLQFWDFEINITTRISHWWCKYKKSLVHQLQKKDFLVQSYVTIIISLAIKGSIWFPKWTTHGWSAVYAVETNRKNKVLWRFEVRVFGALVTYALMNLHSHCMSLATMQTAWLPRGESSRRRINTKSALKGLESHGKEREQGSEPWSTGTALIWQTCSLVASSILCSKVRFATRIFCTLSTASTPILPTNLLLNSSAYYNC
jgi:hypothetical protein